MTSKPDKINGSSADDGDYLLAQSDSELFANLVKMFDLDAESHFAPNPNWFREQAMADLADFLKRNPSPQLSEFSRQEDSQHISVHPTASLHAKAERLQAMTGAQVKVLAAGIRLFSNSLTGLFDQSAEGLADSSVSAKSGITTTLFELPCAGGWSLLGQLKDGKSTVFLQPGSNLEKPLCVEWLNSVTGKLDSLNIVVDHENTYCLAIEMPRALKRVEAIQKASNDKAFYELAKLLPSVVCELSDPNA